MPLTKYGRRECIVITVVAAVVAILPAVLGWWWVLAIVVLLWLALLAFFRDPIRRIPRDLPADALLSPADGRVSAVLEVDHHAATGGPAVIVRIFLSVLDVHVNRAPFDGEVRAIDHTPGKYLNAQTEESARVNESNLITVRITGGETIGIRQVAGMIARRIVCPLTPGDSLARGQKFGMIKFGSTTELILPRPGDVRVHVRRGQKVRGGRTHLASLPPAPHAGEKRGEPNGGRRPGRSPDASS